PGECEASRHSSGLIYLIPNRSFRPWCSGFRFVGTAEETGLRPIGQCSDVGFAVDQTESFVGQHANLKFATAQQFEQTAVALAGLGFTIAVEQFFRLERTL